MKPKLQVCAQIYLVQLSIFFVFRVAFDLVLVLIYEVVVETSGAVQIQFYAAVEESEDREKVSSIVHLKALY